MSSLSVELSSLQQSDYSDVNTIYKAVIEECRIFLSKKAIRDEELHDTLKLESFEHYVDNQSSFVALVDNKQIVGFILTKEIDWINNQSKTLWLEFIGVSPNYRRNSIGLKLLEEAKKYALDHYLDFLYMTLNIDNEPSKNLPIKADFTVRDWRIAHLAIEN